jgi:hypothetical protein
MAVRLPALRAFEVDVRKESNRIVGIVTGYGLDNRDWSLDILFAVTALESTLSPIQSLLAAPSPGEMLPKHEAYYPRPSSVQVRGSIPPLTHSQDMFSRHADEAQG